MNFIKQIILAFLIFVIKIAGTVINSFVAILGIVFVIPVSVICMAFTGFILGVLLAYQIIIKNYLFIKNFWRT
jgi:hypothetical protein